MQLSSAWCHSGGGRGWLALVLLAACGGDGGLHSGVAGDKALADLDSAEVEKICDAVNRYLESAVPQTLRERAACVQRGLVAGTVKQCEAISESCIEAASAASAAADSDAGETADDGVTSASSAGRDSFACYSQSELEDCRASVAELESCIQVSLAGESRMLHAQRCELLDGEVGVGLEAPTRSAVCQALELKCGGVANVTGRIVHESAGPPGQDAGVPGVIGCEELDLTYDGTKCGTGSQCSEVRCTCGSNVLPLIACNPVQGCLTSANCAAVCAASSSSVTLSCAQTQSCTDDSECGDFHCATGSFSGQCTRGEPGDRCDSAGDCSSGLCLSVQGVLTCMGTSEVGSVCTRDLDCASGICQPIAGTAAQCSAGDPGDACASASDCASGPCVYDYSSSRYSCTDRSDGSLCASDSDCLSSNCATGGRSHGVCSNGTFGEACDYDYDCSSQQCKADSETGVRSCGYAPGEECPDGIADCNGDCRPIQGPCVGGSCDALCAGESCNAVTLATWNAADKHSSIALGDSDLTATVDSSYYYEDYGVRATIGQIADKWYWEVVLAAASSSSYYAAVGVTNATSALDLGLGNSSVLGVGFSRDGTLRTSSSSQSQLCSFMAGDVVGVALDVDAGAVYFSINGVWQGGGDPDAGVGGIPLGLDAAAFPVLSLYDSDLVTANFGQNAFEHEPPNGFGALFTP
jgi:hypothetical protein